MKKRENQHSLQLIAKGFTPPKKSGGKNGASKKQPAPPILWMGEILHCFETIGKPMFVGIYLAIIIFQGFLGGAISQPSTVLFKQSPVQKKRTTPKKLNGSPLQKRSRTRGSQRTTLSPTHQKNHPPHPPPPSLPPPPPPLPPPPPAPLSPFFGSSETPKLSDEQAWVWISSSCCFRCSSSEALLRCSSRWRVRIGRPGTTYGRGSKVGTQNGGNRANGNMDSCGSLMFSF